jgi:hypothetical protein
MGDGRGRVEHHLHLDIRRMRRDGLLSSGAGPGSPGYDQASETNVEVIDWTLIRATWIDLADDAERINYIKIGWQPRGHIPGRKTGYQPWFYCPFCGKPRAMLYRFNSGNFACRGRTCHNLGHECERESYVTKRSARAAKLKRRISAGRPKFMHRKTWEALQATYGALAAELVRGAERRPKSTFRPKKPKPVKLPPRDPWNGYESYRISAEIRAGTYKPEPVKTYVQAPRGGRLVRYLPPQPVHEIEEPEEPEQEESGRSLRGCWMPTFSMGRK